MNVAEIFSKSTCCGCGACVNACPVNAISYGKDELGFIIPNFDPEKCISCGKCVRCCPYQNIEEQHEIEFTPVVYAALNANPEIVKNSSSGGIFYSLAKNVIERQGVVFGAAMDDSFKVRHIFVDSLLDLKKIQKSKYVQSFLDDTYAKVKSFLKDDRYVLFSGTPCQIAGLNSFLQNRKYENLLTVEVVCHGVPNQDLFDDYLKHIESKVGKIQEYTFRYKSKPGNGMKWYSSYRTEKKRFVRNWPEDSYNYYYMKSLIYRDSCYTCKFASSKRNADITLCDYWHWDELHKKDFYENASVSGIVVNTSKGNECINRISSCVKLIKSDFGFLASNNSCLVHSCGVKKDREIILNMWKQDGYAVLDKAFKQKYRIQILKYKFLRRLPGAVLTFSHRMKSWMSK